MWTLWRRMQFICIFVRVAKQILWRSPCQRWWTFWVFRAHQEMARFVQAKQIVWRDQRLSVRMLAEKIRFLQFHEAFQTDAPLDFCFWTDQFDDAWTIKQRKMSVLKTSNRKLKSLNIQSLLILAHWSNVYHLVHVSELAFELGTLLTKSKYVSVGILHIRGRSTFCFYICVLYVVTINNIY